MSFTRLLPNLNTLSSWSWIACDISNFIHTLHRQQSSSSVTRPHSISTLSIYLHCKCSDYCIPFNTAEKYFKSGYFANRLTSQQTTPVPSVYIVAPGHKVFLIDIHYCVNRVNYQEIQTTPSRQHTDTHYVRHINTAHPST